MDRLKIITIFVSTLLAIVALILDRNNFHLEFNEGLKEVSHPL
ncbi:hypothetical protein PQ743_12715 [Thermoanaerobacterium thermosaccharolyticum]